MSQTIEQRLISFRARKAALNSVERIALCALALFVILLPLVIGFSLLASSWDLFREKPLFELFSDTLWNPARGQLSFLPMLAGTLWVTMLAVLFAFPVAFGVAIFLAEYAGRRLAAVLKPALDIVTGLPSVIFGLWGVLVVVPIVKDLIAPLFGVQSTGYTVLTAGLVLAFMILPLLTQVMFEVFDSVPRGLKEAALALGATRWEVIRKAVIPASFPGIIASIVLALSRAFGETLAVMMVVGNVVQIPAHPLSPGSTLPAFFANKFGEMFTMPVYHRALLFAAFLLFIVVFCFTVISHIVLTKLKKGMS